jgi:hypothetical protein
MGKLLKWDLLSIAFVASILVFGSSLVFLVTFDISHKGQILFIIFIVASFFTSISLALQLKEKRKQLNDKKQTQNFGADI